jgi:cell division protein FtsL
MKKIINSDDAVVGIVITVLLIGLVMSVIVMLNTVYVPQWLEESEAAHMEEVSDQFTQLKYALDIQSLVNDSTVMTTSVKLGTREIPFFNSGRTFGSLIIDDDSFNMTIERWNDTVPTSIVTDSIKFSSGNSHFVNQQYIYEAGSLILAQDDANIVYGKPSIFVNGFGNNSTITFVIVNISGVSGKTSVSGYGIYPIYTQVLSTYPTYAEYESIYNVTKITIRTKYANSWNKTIASVFNIEHFNESHYSLTEFSDRVEIEFYDAGSDYYYVRYRIINVSTQISSGIAD